MVIDGGELDVHRGRGAAAAAAAVHVAGRCCAADRLAAAAVGRLVGGVDAPRQREQAVDAVLRGLQIVGGHGECWMGLVG